MSGMASQITSLTNVYSTVYPGADQIKHQSSASLAFVRGMASNAETVSIWWRHHVVSYIFLFQKLDCNSLEFLDIDDR